MCLCLWILDTGCWILDAGCLCTSTDSAKTYICSSMQNPVRHTIHNNSFWLSAQRCIFWEEEKALILSDLHFGKTGHFRKAGIAVPQAVYKDDLHRLVSTIQHFNATQLIIVGDLFHSHANKEFDLFKRWRSDLSQVSMRLIKGNHDILHDEWYRESGMEVHEEELKIHRFCFRHDADPETSGEKAGEYTFSGHIHPGVSIRGMAKQSLHFPCFYFTSTQCVLPAFSRFTGTYTIEPKKGDSVFAIVEDRLVGLGG